jgi:hypothetical protein
MFKNDKSGDEATKKQLGIILNNSGSSAQSEDTSSDTESQPLTVELMDHNSSRKPTNRSASSSNFLTASNSQPFGALNSASKQGQRRRSIFDHLDEDEAESFSSEHNDVNELLRSTVAGARQPSGGNAMRQILSADNVRLQQTLQVPPLVQFSFASDCRLADGKQFFFRLP